jgi:hypothetical protein
MLDCCFSASLTRRDIPIASQDGNDADKYRYLPNPPRFNPNDTSLWSAIPPPSETDILIAVKSNLPMRKGVYGFTAMYNDSHILLAACGRSEVAKEGPKGALFTSLFLRALEPMPSFQGLSYRMLFAFLPISWVISNSTVSFD